MCDELQRATATRNEPQQARASRSEPQLRYKGNKARKKLHTLVYAFSPLSPLTAGVLMKIVLMLVPRVRSARRCLPIPGTHTMFRHHSACGGMIWT